MTMKSKGMNIILWVLQIALGFYMITGGIYMMGHYQELAKGWTLNVLPNPFWMILGMLQILLALGIILPGIIKKYHKLISISAGGLILISLLGIALYVAYEGLGILWGLIPAIIAGFVAYGRMES